VKREEKIFRTVGSFKEW